MRSGQGAQGHTPGALADERRLFRLHGQALRTPEAVRLCLDPVLANTSKYRKKLGVDIALEALRRWSERRVRLPEALLAQARHCRVERVILPYLEALI